MKTNDFDVLQLLQAMPSRRSKWLSTSFDDCEIRFDPEFGQVIVESRGYEVIIELGNTDKWKTGCETGGFDEALHIIVNDSSDWTEEEPFADFFVPKLEDKNDE